MTNTRIKFLRRPILRFALESSSRIYRTANFVGTVIRNSSGKFRARYPENGIFEIIARGCRTDNSVSATSRMLSRLLRGLLAPYAQTRVFRDLLLTRSFKVARKSLFEETRGKRAERFTHGDKAPFAFPRMPGETF